MLDSEEPCILALILQKDVRYLTPYIEEAYQEDQERAAWDNMDVKVVRKVVH